MDVPKAQLKARYVARSKRVAVRPQRHGDAPHHRGEGVRRAPQSGGQKEGHLAARRVLPVVPAIGVMTYTLSMGDPYQQAVRPWPVIFKYGGVLMWIIH